MSTIKGSKVYLGTGDPLGLSSDKQIFTNPGTTGNSFKVTLDKDTFTAGVWSPIGPVSDKSFVGSTLGHSIHKLTAIKNWIKPSTYKSEKTNQDITRKHIKKLKNLNHNLTLHKELDEIFKTINDFDLFWILIEAYLTEHHLIDSYYKSLSKINKLFARTGPGLMSFLDDANIWNYNPSNFSIDTITGVMKEFWYPKKSVTSYEFIVLDYGANKKGGI